MKNIKYIIIFITFILFNGCKKYLDVNENPATPQTTTAGVLLAPIFASMDRGEAFDGRYAGQYVQYWGAPAAANVYDRFGYTAGSDSQGEKWSTHYYRIGSNVDLMAKLAEANEQWDYLAVAQAIKAWSWQTTTDVYGEMIFRQAGDQTRSVFDFDPQEEVYAEVKRLCNLALINIDRTDGKVLTSNLPKYDLVYKGDRAKWKKFIYAVLALNAHHISNKASYNPQTVIDYVDKSFASNADDFLIPHNGKTTDDSNFWGPLRQNLNGFRQSDYMVRLLDGRIFRGIAVADTLSDPRLTKMLTLSKDLTYRGVGVATGDANSASNTSTARIPFLWGNFSTSVPIEGSSFAPKYIYKNSSSIPMMAYSQLQFMKAEAEFIRAGNVGTATALTAYKNGIGAHIDFVSANSIAPISATAKAAYLAGPSVAQTDGALKLSDIMQQKYIALFVWGNLETWVDMRRYRYSTAIYQGFTLPVSPQSIFSDNFGKLPYRARPRYNSEYVWNFESLKKIGGDLPDFHTKEPWFILP